MPRLSRAAGLFAIDAEGLIEHQEICPDHPATLGSLELVLHPQMQSRLRRLTSRTSTTTYAT